MSIFYKNWTFTCFYVLEENQASKILCDRDRLHEKFADSFRHVTFLPVDWPTQTGRLRRDGCSFIEGQICPLDVSHISRTLNIGFVSLRRCDKGNLGTWEEPPELLVSSRVSVNSHVESSLLTKESVDLSVLIETSTNSVSSSNSLISSFANGAKLTRLESCEPNCERTPPSEGAPMPAGLIQARYDEGRLFCLV